MPSAVNVIQVAPSCTEHDLVAWVRAGNDEAYEELYHRYCTRIGAYVLGMVSDHGRAEDIAQDVFISALRRLRDTEQPIAFKPWIYEIAKNACVDEFRRTRRAREVPLPPEDESHDVALHAPATLDSTIESRQRLDDLRGAFKGLSETHHQIIVMRELEGKSYREIGERLGMSKAMVESTLFRARRRLSEEYDELVSGRRCQHVQELIAADGERPLRSLGVRERRQLARHLAHCQPCRRQARLARVDEQFFKAPSLARRLAGLLPLPLPWLPWRRSRGMRGSGSSPMPTIVQLQSAAQYVDPSVPVFDLGRAAAAAAALVIGGAGGGLLVSASGQQRSGSHAGNTGALASASAAKITPGTKADILSGGGLTADGVAASIALNPLTPFGATTQPPRHPSQTAGGQGEPPLSLPRLLGLGGGGSGGPLGGLSFSGGGASAGASANGSYTPGAPGLKIPNLGGLINVKPLRSITGPSSEQQTGGTQSGGQGSGVQGSGSTGTGSPGTTTTTTTGGSPGSGQRSGQPSGGPNGSGGARGGGGSGGSTGSGGPTGSGGWGAPTTSNGPQNVPASQPGPLHASSSGGGSGSSSESGSQGSESR